MQLEIDRLHAQIGRLLVDSNRAALDHVQKSSQLENDLARSQNQSRILDEQLMHSRKQCHDLQTQLAEAQRRYELMQGELTVKSDLVAQLQSQQEHQQSQHSAKVQRLESTHQAVVTHLHEEVDRAQQRIRDMQNEGDELRRQHAQQLAAVQQQLASDRDRFMQSLSTSEQQRVQAEQQRQHKLEQLQIQLAEHQQARQELERRVHQQQQQLQQQQQQPGHSNSSLVQDLEQRCRQQQEELRALHQEHDQMSLQYRRVCEREKSSQRQEEQLRQQLQASLLAQQQLQQQLDDQLRQLKQYQSQQQEVQQRIRADSEALVERSRSEAKAQLDRITADKAKYKKMCQQLKQRSTELLDQLRHWQTSAETCTQQLVQLQRERDEIERQRDDWRRQLLAGSVSASSAQSSSLGIQF